MRVLIIGGGPGGYEAALVAADLGAEVTIVNDEGLGGACVLWDCVPSKTLLTSAQAFNTLETAPSLGVHFEGMLGQQVPRYEVDLPTIMARVRDLALAQSEDISKRVLEDAVRVVLGRGRIADPHTVEVVGSGGMTVDAPAALETMLDERFRGVTRDWVLLRMPAAGEAVVNLRVQGVTRALTVLSRSSLSAVPFPGSSRTAPTAGDVPRTDAPPTISRIEAPSATRSHGSSLHVSPARTGASATGTRVVKAKTIGAT